MNLRFRIRPIRTIHAVRAAAVAGALVVGAVGCDSQSGDEQQSDVPETATGTLEQLAAKVKCEPDIQTDAEELRQAKCQTKEGRWILLTFKAKSGQRTWIEGAKDYGGSYLVGKRWVAVGDVNVVTALRSRLGGTLEAGKDHSQHSSGQTGGSDDS